MTERGFGFRVEVLSSQRDKPSDHREVSDFVPECMSSVNYLQIIYLLSYSLFTYFFLHKEWVRRKNWETRNTWTHRVPGSLWTLVCSYRVGDKRRVFGSRS